MNSRCITKKSLQWSNWCTILKSVKIALQTREQEKQRWAKDNQDNLVIFHHLRMTSPTRRESEECYWCCSFPSLTKTSGRTGLSRKLFILQASFRCSSHWSNTNSKRLKTWSFSKPSAMHKQYQWLKVNTRFHIQGPQPSTNNIK